MKRILCLESSTDVCSVAIAEDGKVVDSLEDVSGQNHSRLLTHFISQLLESNRLRANDLNAVAVSEGPGSYTGLRIGVSVAKGFCYAAGIPLIAISSLEAMASYVVENMHSFNIETARNNLFVPMIDARRMEVYMAIYDSNLQPVQKVNAMVVELASFIKFTENSQLFLFGNGSAKCKDILINRSFRFLDGVNSSSLHMANLADQKYSRGEFADLAYFEPFYLKDFIATIPKNNVLNPPLIS
jgi:tRNA threonylcarbamoyladenosine biosynthesis protein TsaB